MIHFNASIGSFNNKIVAEFGKGDISIITGIQSTDDKTVVLFFTNQEPREIGSENSHGKEPKDINPDITFIISNIKSIDTIISALNTAKQDLIELQKEV